MGSLVFLPVLSLLMQVKWIRDEEQIFIHLNLSRRDFIPKTSSVVGTFTYVLKPRSPNHTWTRGFLAWTWGFWGSGFSLLSLFVFLPSLPSWAFRIKELHSSNLQVLLKTRPGRAADPSTPRIGPAAARCCPLPARPCHRFPRHRGGVSLGEATSTGKSVGSFGRAFVFPWGSRRKGFLPCGVVSFPPGLWVWRTPGMVTWQNLTISISTTHCWEQSTVLPLILHRKFPHHCQLGNLCNGSNNLQLST